MSQGLDPEAALSPEGFERLQQVLLESERQVYPARSWAPSMLGHPCDRFLVYRWTRHAQQRVHTTTLQSIFNQGRTAERRIRGRMEELGFTITESDRPTQWTVKGATISGRIDGKLVGYRGHRYLPPRIWEAKSMSGFQWERLHSAAELRTSSHHYVRNYYAQIQLYMYLEAVPQAVITLESKATGLLKSLAVDLDYGYVEEILTRVERLQGVLDAHQDPPPIPYDRETCGDCGFNHICFPAKLSGEAVHVFEDAELLDTLEEWGATVEAAQRHAALDRDIKARIRAEIEDGEALCGPWAIAVNKVTKNIKATAATVRTETHVKLSRVE